MAVVLKHEEPERTDETRKLHLIPGKHGQAAGTATAEMEFPYDDLYLMYDYITKELGIK